MNKLIELIGDDAELKGELDTLIAEAVAEAEEKFQEEIEKRLSSARDKMIKDLNAKAEKGEPLNISEKPKCYGKYPKDEPERKCRSCVWHVACKKKGRIK